MTQIARQKIVDAAKTLLDPDDTSVIHDIMEGCQLDVDALPQRHYDMVKRQIVAELTTICGLIDTHYAVLAESNVTRELAGHPPATDVPRDDDFCDHDDLTREGDKYRCEMCGTTFEPPSPTPDDDDPPANDIPPTTDELPERWDGMS